MTFLRTESPSAATEVAVSRLARYYVTVARAARQRRAVKHILCDTGEGESRHDYPPRNFH